MWKRILLGIVRTAVQEKILDYVMSLKDVQKKADAITFLKAMKNWMLKSNSSTTRAIGNLIPFGDE